MNTNAAAYWIAVGALALGLNSEYHQGRFVALHRAAERAGSVLCQAATRAEQTLAVATELTTSHTTLSDNFLPAVDRSESARDQAAMIRDQARAQAEMVREQVREQILAQRDILRAQVEVRRAGIQQLRWQVRNVNSRNAGHESMTVLCQKTGGRIVVRDLSDDELPTVEVSDEF